MRRRFLQNLAAVGLITISRVGNAKSGDDGDPRLFGTWQSDRDLTMKYRKFAEETPDHIREKFAQLYGKATWRVTKERIYFTNDKLQYSMSYQVVAKDEDSVVLSMQGRGPAYLQYIRFEGNYFY